jgi:hypothetical protein
MGHYTKFTFDATLSKSAPVEVVDYMRTRLTRNEELDGEAPNQPFGEHPFFNCQRWHWVLTWHNCNDNGFKAWCKDTDDGLVIHIDTDLKNYCHSIEWFILWIAPIVNLDHACRYKIEFEDDGTEESDCSELIRSIQQRVDLDSVNINQLEFRSRLPEAEPNWPYVE